MTVPVTERDEIDSPLTIGEEESAVHYAASSGIQPGPQRGGARGRASKPSTSLRAVKEAITDSDGKPAVTKAQDAAQALADGMAGRIKSQLTAMAAGPSLWDARPPTLREEWAYLVECIDHLEHGWQKALRGAYGVLRLPFILASRALEWSTRSLPGFLVTCVIGFVIWTYR